MNPLFRPTGLLLRRRAIFQYLHGKFRFFAALSLLTFPAAGQNDSGWGGSDWTAVIIGVDASGGNATNGPGGNGGTVDIRTGWNVDPGDGRDRDVTTSRELHGGASSPSQFFYRQVAPLRPFAPETELVLTIHGKVEIHTQYIFRPSKIVAVFEPGMPPPELTIYAGAGIQIHDTPIEIIPGTGTMAETSFLSHQVNVEIKPPEIDDGAGNEVPLTDPGAPGIKAGTGINGGSVTFWTAQRGKVAGSVVTEGGAGALGGNGGDGGAITIAALDRMVSGFYLTSGGEGGPGFAPPFQERSDGGNAGNGGNIAITGAGYDGPAILGAAGGKGGVGAAGDTDHPDGWKGGNGGGGGYIRIQTPQPALGLNVSAIGGMGGRGGAGRIGDNYPEEFQLRHGSNGGSGGTGGASGFITGVVPTNPFFPVLFDGGKGGDGGPGGNGGRGDTEQMEPGGNGGAGGKAGDGGSAGGAGPQPGNPGAPGLGKMGGPGLPNGTAGAAGDAGTRGTVQENPIPPMPPVPGAPVKPWTILVYIAADSTGSDDIEDEEIIELNRWEQCGNCSAAGINVLVQMDRHEDSRWGEPSVPGSASWDNWGNTRRAWVMADAYPYQVSTPFFNLPEGEVNTGESAPLAAFIRWGIAQAPADRYVLVLVGHGNGARGILHDSSSRLRPGLNDRLLPRELSSALAAAGNRFSVVEVSACTAQTAELASEIFPYAEYLVGHQGSSRAFEPRYDAWLRDLAAFPARTTAAVAENVWSQSANKTCSLLDLDPAKISRFGRAFDALAQAVLTPPVDYSSVDRARRSTVMFKHDQNRDVGGFLDALAGDAGASPAIRSSATEARIALDEIVLRKRSHSGLSFHFPDPALDGGAYTIIPNNFNGAVWQSLWMQWWISLHPGQHDLLDSIMIDLPDHPISAPVLQGSAQNVVMARLETANDKDFVSFNAEAGDALYANWIGPADVIDLNVKLTVYAPDQTTVVAAANSHGNGGAALERVILPGTGTYYLAIERQGAALSATAGAKGLSPLDYYLYVVIGDPTNLAPRISVTNVTLPFGLVGLGAQPERSLRIANAGGTTLYVTNFLAGTNSLFGVPYPFVPLPLEIAAGSFVDLPISLFAVSNAVANTLVRIQSSDPLQGEIIVSLTAEIIQPPSFILSQVNGSMFAGNIWVADARQYRLQSSTNLATWTDVLTFSSTSNTFPFSVPVGAPPSSRFFRITTE